MSGSRPRVQRVRFAAAVAVVIGSVLLVEAALILWTGGWPAFLPTQLDAVAALLSLFGARARTFGGAVAAALSGLFLLCAGVLELRRPRA
ncbi:MAG TPA: hypothetical protein VMU00_00175 [Steroidobacteraceae bacterium]|nr:hypothetical protein [Steroidobacteraceae bacterium]